MQFKYLKRFVLILLLIESSRASAAFITTKIVDVSGRPLADVAVEIYFLKSYSEHDVRRISLATLVSDKDGIVVGTYDENSIPADESFFVSLTKNGYHGYDRSFDFNRSFSDVIPNLVMEREFNDDDVRLIASLSGEMQVDALRELLSGRYTSERYDSDLEERIFAQEHLFRAALRNLAGDPKVGTEGMRILALIGVPEDLRGGAFFELRKESYAAQHIECTSFVYE